MEEIKDVLALRGNVHGEFRHNAVISQQLKDVIKRTKNYDALCSNQKEALDMICSKISRILSGDPDFPDHWLDIEGYARLVYNSLPKNREMQEEMK
jgi:hypothetical protein